MAKIPGPSSCASSPAVAAMAVFFLGCSSTTPTSPVNNQPTTDTVAQDTGNPATDTGNPSAATIQINADPDDSHLATITSPSGTAWLFGTKDATGAAKHADKVVIDDGKQVVTELLDSFDRPTMLGDSTGRSAQFTYSDTSVTIVFKMPGGTAETQVIPLAQLPGFPQGPAPGTQSGALTQGDRPITVVTHVRVLNAGKPVQDVVDAQVIANITNKSLKYPGAYDPGLGGYSFQFVHRTVPLDNGREQCMKLFGTASTAYTHVGTAVALLAAFCLATPAAPVCAAMASWAGVIGGATLAVGGTATTIKANNCDDLVIPADPTTMTVSVAVSHPVFGTGSGSASYDITKALDPVNAIGRLDINVDFNVTATILSITTEPPAPVAHQDYQFRFTYTPAGGVIQWSLTGTDNFHKAGTAAGGPTATSVLSDVIPGGAAKVKDKVDAVLLIGDQKVSELTWEFTFH